MAIFMISDLLSRDLSDTGRFNRQPRIIITIYYENFFARVSLTVLGPYLKVQDDPQTDLTADSSPVIRDHV